MLSVGLCLLYSDVVKRTLVDAEFSDDDDAADVSNPHHSCDLCRLMHCALDLYNC